MEDNKSLNFIEEIIEEYLSKHPDRKINTRFPPEPNGYLHIGHAKSICLNFGLAEKYDGLCNLRFDDTNPAKEEQEYINSIREDVRWLGFDWGDREYYASDYFEQLYQWAIEMIKAGRAYVDDQSAEVMSQQRGVPTRPGIESPYRNRSVEENLDLFERMKQGEFAEGERVLRAKIDMASPNMHMRDPVMYRIMHVTHHRTGDKWKIYPMYDWAHGESDFLEGITHSLCTLEFEIHRPLYEWFVSQVTDSDIVPRQIEFARLNINYTVMSKRKLQQLVKENHVNGWDDPRMPTISGLRRRGYTPESIRNFADRVGIAKRDNIIEVGLLEHSIREDLNHKAPRIFGVLDPIKLIITNYPEEKTENLEIEMNPEQPELGNRIVPFGRELYIERNDFMEEAPKKYFRLAPEKEVRLKGAYFVKCTGYDKDQEGKITTVYATYDPETKSGTGVTRKVKGTIHWVSVKHALDCEVRLYDRLFLKEDPDNVEEDKTFIDYINPDSLKIVQAKLEPSIQNTVAGDKYQFMRIGYFCVDKDSSNEKIVFNRTVALKDSWKKQNSKKR
jgi:glutaminyl-tRNA synthetase